MKKRKIIGLLFVFSGMILILREAKITGAVVGGGFFSWITMVGLLSFLLGGVMVLMEGTKGERTNLIKRLIRGEVLDAWEAEKLGNLDNTEPSAPIKYIIHGNKSLGDSRYNNMFPVSYAHKNLDAKTEGELKSIDGLEHEEEMQKKAYEKGIRVPYCEGICNVYNMATKSFVPALVMERIYGTDQNVTYGSDPKVTEWWKRQIKKTEDNDFFICDETGNIMRDDRQRLFLIDTEHWEYDGE